MVTLTFANITSSSLDIYYESNTEIAGFQFKVEENVPIAGVSDGAAGDAGFTLTTSNNTILGFSLSGATIPPGSGTLISLEFEEILESNTLEVTDVVISGPGGSSIPNYGPGSIVITTTQEDTPELFNFNQSTLQAFYYFKLVLINDHEVESTDWVGAFKGDNCVGARQWDTTQCGGGICDVPVMGDDGNDYTNGYMQIGDIPTFKIFDASENLYYTAESSENSGWFSNGMPLAEILSANVTIPGCTDSNYCNYDLFATEDDGSCDDSCLGCTDEDACNYNASATIDNGSCWSAEENYDCGGNCIAEVDCSGNCGGSAVLDLCGECDNYIATNGIQPDFPYGECDCLGMSGGNAYNDNCGECDDNDSNNCTKDCSDEWGGSSNEDNCGVCDNNASNDCVQDCSGVWGGSLVIDECGVCDGPGSTSECGCSDITEGFCDCEENILDQCGICSGNNSTCLDCAGDPNGDAVLDNCSICDNDSTNDCMQDCNGNWGGDAVIDDCGICNNDSSNDCNQDCAGIWGGSAEIDDCEICGGDGPEENYDCEGNCEAELDCQGICGGLNSATIQCQNGCIVCNPIDCNNLDNDCNSMDISPNLSPDEFGISKIFPNPFNPVTQIEYEITQYGLVAVKLFDIRGRVVEQLINEYHSSGHYNLTWDASNHASGMYFVEMIMQSGNTTISRDMKKILYLK